MAECVYFTNTMVHQFILRGEELDGSDRDCFADAVQLLQSQHSLRRYAG